MGFLWRPIIDGVRCVSFFEKNQDDWVGGASLSESHFDEPRGPEGPLEFLYLP